MASSLSPSPKRAASALYTLREISDLLGIDYFHASRLAKADKLPVKPIRVGSRLMFPKTTVDRVLALDDVNEGAS